MAGGFPLTGPLPDSGLFRKQPRPTPALTQKELERRAPAARRACLGMMGPSKDPELDAAVEEATREEVGKGWLLGPFTEQELGDLFGEWLPVRRFGVRQGSRVRPIDDYSMFGQNAATSVPERVDMLGVDTLAAAEEPRRGPLLPAHVRRRPTARKRAPCPRGSRPSWQELGPCLGVPPAGPRPR